MLSIVTTVKDIERLRQITTVLARHGFGEVLQRAGLGGGKKEEGEEEARRISLAERLRLALQDLGPSFIKLGQIVSTRPDLIPADIIVELKKLQDNVPPMSLEDVKATIAETLGAPAEEIYASFDEKPLACASIGQVHRATLRGEGEGAPPVEVVVKVQRPRIRATIERDLDLLYFLARVVERAIPESRIYSPVGLVAEFDRAIMAELDFTVEASNAEAFAANFAGKESFVRFPQVYKQASGKKVLTLEFFDGKKIYAAVVAGASGATIARNAVAVIVQMIFEDGLFHADPHPGNILILGPPEAPVLGMLDLGLVGRLSAEMRDRTVDLMVAAVRSDDAAIADALLAMGRPRGTVDQGAFRAEVSMLARKYLNKPLNEIEISALIRDLVQGAVKYEIEMPTEMLMVGKSLMTVEGIGKEIYPELDVFTEVRPHFMKLLWKRYSPDRLAREGLRVLSDLATAARNLPAQVHQILEDLRAGRLEVKSVDPNLPGATDRLGRRIYTSVVVGAMTVGGTGLLAVGRHEGFAWTLLGIAGGQMLLHVGGDLKRKYTKQR
jgi:ubiquinone biosynthesis protein